MTPLLSSSSLIESEQALVDVCKRLDAATTDEERMAITPLVCKFLEVAETNRDEFVRLLAFLTAKVQMLDTEAKRIAAAKKRLMGAIEMLQGAAINVIQVAGSSRLEGKTSVLKIRRNPPKLIITDENALPRELYREITSLELDRAALKDRLLAGESVPGADIGYGWRLEVE